MKFSKILGVTALAAVMAVSACGRVPAGYEGVIVNMYGSDRGVQAKETGVGWVFYGPGKELYQFPTFTQNIEWTKGDAFEYQDKDGLILAGDIGVSYYVKPGMSDELYIKYRRGIDEITQVFVRNMIRDAMVKHSSMLTAEEAYSTKK